MRVVFFGSGEFAVPTLRWAAQCGDELVAVVSQPARAGGRGRRPIRTPAAQCAAECNLPVFEVENVNTKEVLDPIKALNAQLGLVVAFGQKLGRELLDSFPLSCINLHASLLPAYRGAAPIQRAILDGCDRTGCTVFRLVERMDAGPILSSRWTSIKPEETSGELHDRLAGIGVDAVQAAWALFAGGQVPEGTPQEESQATMAPKLKKEDGHVRFDRPARAVARHICGMTPWPGASARFQGREGRWEEVQLIRARLDESPGRPSLKPGALDGRLFIAAADGFVELLEIKPSSGRVMAWAEYVNGRHVREGDTFVSP